MFAYIFRRVLATIPVPDVPLREPRTAFDDTIYRPDS